MVHHPRVFGVFTLLAVLLACGSTEPDVDRAAAFRELMYPPTELTAAEDRAVTACMRRSGWSYQAATAPSNDHKQRSLLRLSAPDDTTNAPSPVDAFVEKLSSADRDRFHRDLLGNGVNDIRVTLPGGHSFGAPSTGCLAEARTAVYGTVGNYLTVIYLPELAQRHVGEVYDDPAVTAAWATHDSCVANGGAGCRAGLDDALVAAANRVALRWIGENGPAVDEAHRLLRKALSRVSQNS